MPLIICCNALGVQNRGFKYIQTQGYSFECNYYKLISNWSAQVACSGCKCTKYYGSNRAILLVSTVAYNSIYTCIECSHHESYSTSELYKLVMLMVVFTAALYNPLSPHIMNLDGPYIRFLCNFLLLPLHV